MTGTSIDGLAGWRRLHLPAVGSTNEEALDLAAAGDSGRLWVTAGEQLSGRGRRGRGWVSPPGNLYGSALLVDPAPLSRLGALPLVAAIAVRDAIAACGLPDGTELAIKWPNDILLDGAKCCGMLLESRPLVKGPLAVVIGCGINIAHHPEPGIYPATSLNRAGIEATPETLFANLARAMDAALSLWDGGRNVAAIRDRWMENARGIGKTIAVNLATDRLEGLFQGIDADGLLLLRDARGTIHSVSAGDLFFDNDNSAAGATPVPRPEQE